MAVDVVPDGKQGSTPENLVGSDAAVCNRIGSGSMSCGRDEPQDSAAKGWVVVTGASGGIGAVLTEQLAKEGYPVVMACRNLEKARPVQQAVMVRSGNRRVVLYPLDLASLDSVRRFTGRLRSEKMQVAVLLNNAGKVLTQRQLLNQVWGPNAVEHSHYLRIYMGHLRQKLELDPARPRHFLTETGIGYRFMP